MKAPASTALGRVAFELSRLEVVGDWVHVEGEWSGVRGRRLAGTGPSPWSASTDALDPACWADLATNKPWAAEETGPWKATFPYTIERTDSDQAELCVAPDLAIMLPVPERRPGTRKRSTSRGKRVVSEMHRTDDPTPAIARRRNAAQPMRRAGDSSEALARELAELRDSPAALTAPGIDQLPKCRTGNRMAQPAGRDVCRAARR